MKDLLYPCQCESSADLDKTNTTSPWSSCSFETWETAETGNRVRTRQTIFSKLPDVVLWTVHSEKLIPIWSGRKIWRRVFQSKCSLGYWPHSYCMELRVYWINLENSKMMKNLRLRYLYVLPIKYLFID